MASRYHDRKTKKGRYTKHFRPRKNFGTKFSNSSSGEEGYGLPTREQMDQMQEDLDQMNEQTEQQYNYERIVSNVVQQGEFGVVITRRDEDLDTAIVISDSDMVERERRVVENNGVTENGGIDEDGAMQQAIEMSQDEEELMQETLSTSSTSSSSLIVEVADRSATPSEVADRSAIPSEVADHSATPRSEEPSFHITVFARDLRTNKPVPISVYSDTFDGLLGAIYEKMGIDEIKRDPWLSVGDTPLMPHKSLCREKNKVRFIDCITRYS